MLRIRTYKVNLYTAALVAYGLLMAVLYGIHPFLCDDVIMRDLMVPFLDAPSVSTFLSSAANRISTTWLCDNGRLTQMLAPILVTAPRWLTGLPIALCVALCIYYSALMAGVWQQKPLLFGLLVLMWTLIMPWPDFMFCVIHAYNYIPPLCLTLWLLYHYTEGTLKPGAAFWLSLLVAWWHELYGASLIGAATGMALFFKYYRTRTSFNMALGALFGIIYLMLVPGTARRSGGLLFAGLSQPTAVLYYALPFVCFLFMFALARLRPSLWKHLSLQKLCCFTFAALPGLIIWRLLLFGSRLTWPLMALSAIGICYILGAFTFRRFHRAVQIIGCVFVLLSLTQLTVCIPWFVRMAHDVEQADIMPRDAEGNIYYNFTTPADAPWYILGKPNFVSYKAWAPNYRYVLPTALHNFSPTEATYSGIIDGRKVFLYNDLIVFEGEIAEEKQIWVELDGAGRILDAMPRSFTAPDGNEYTYMYVNKPIRLAHSKISAVSALE